MKPFGSGPGGRPGGGGRPRKQKAKSAKRRRREQRFWKSVPVDLRRPSRGGHRRREEKTISAKRRRREQRFSICLHFILDRGPPSLIGVDKKGSEPRAKSRVTKVCVLQWSPSPGPRCVIGVRQTKRVCETGGSGGSGGGHFLVDIKQRAPKHQK